MAVTVGNTTADLTGKTILKAEDAQTVTGLKTFDRGASAPFAVLSGAGVVPYLDADKLDGQEGAFYRDASNLNAGTIPQAQIPTFLHVQFPAVQVPNGDPNALDDYEEGTWVPTVSGDVTPGTQTYGTRGGYYTKIGRQITASFELTLATKDAATAGAIQISGLPSAAAVAPGATPTGVVYFSNMATTWNVLAGYVPGANTVIVLFGTKVAGTGIVAVQAADIAAGLLLYGSVTYFV